MANLRQLWNFSSFKRIFSNHVKFRPIFLTNRYFSPGFPTTLRTSSALNDEPKTFSISKIFQATPQTLRIEFKDDLAANFHFIWLRDNCKCNKCIHPKTKQKYLDTVSLNLNVSPNSYSLTGSGTLKIVWKEKDKEHYSYYDPLWLYRYALGFERNLYEAVHDGLPPIECWTGKCLEENLPEIQYDEVVHSKEGIRWTLEGIHKFGILFVRNVPQEPGEVIKVINRIASVKSTRWGSSYHVTTNDIFDDPAYIPHTEEKMALHTDMDYLESSPGVQVVHCLQAKIPFSNIDKAWNGTYFVDGFLVAKWLREHHPMHFQTLVSIPVKFRMFTQNMKYMNYHPIIKLNKSREITEVHFNNRMMAPLEGPSTSIFDFYAAYKVFGERIRERENQFRMTLRAGDIVILDNRRVLHGRRSYDTTQIKKHLEGCYADMDEVLAGYRTFLRKETNTQK